MSEGLRIIVCGGRDYADRQKLNEVMEALHAERPIKHLWHGNARGADSLADWWGHKHAAVSVHPVSAEWSKYGRRAGPMRNQKMLGNNIDLVVAFPGGRGTADMIKRAEDAGVEVLHVA
jgi:hypothetical protein